MKKWTVIYSVGFTKDFAKLDRAVQVMVRTWIGRHLLLVEDPRIFGKPLTGNLKGLWRYRIGNYRIICEINDYTLIIRFISIGHRREIYK